jgi:hypothetical protein
MLLLNPLLNDPEVADFMHLAEISKSRWPLRDHNGTRIILRGSLRYKHSNDIYFIPNGTVLMEKDALHFDARQSDLLTSYTEMAVPRESCAEATLKEFCERSDCFAQILRC